MALRLKDLTPSAPINVVLPRTYNLKLTTYNSVSLLR